MGMAKNSQRIVITGGSGFVGQWLQEELRAHGYLLDSWDRPEVDITDPSTYRTRLEQDQPAWVVHLAAVSSVALSWQDPAVTQRVNVEGTRALLEAIQEVSPATHVLAISTADIYGAVSERPLAELPLDDARPNNPYAQSKWDMEQLIETAFSDRCIRVRPFPHIGPGQAKGFVTSDFASQIAAIEKGIQEPIIRVGNLSAQRDFTDVRDVVRAYRLLLEKGEPGDVYHVASGVPRSIQDILDQLRSLTTVEIGVEPDPERQRPSDTPILVGDASKLKKQTGWMPEIGLGQSLQDILDYWREQI